MDYVIKKIILKPDPKGIVEAKIYSYKSDKDGWKMARNKKVPKTFIDDLLLTPKDMVKLEKMVVRALKKAEHKNDNN